MLYNVKTIGKRLKELRKSRGMTQEEFGSIVKPINDKTGTGVTKRTVQNWESGNQVPDIKTLFTICEIYDCELGYILGEYDTLKRTITDIHEQTGLSAKAVEILENNRAQVDKFESSGFYKASNNPKEYLPQNAHFLDFISKAIEFYHIAYDDIEAIIRILNEEKFLKGIIDSTSDLYDKVIKRQFTEKEAAVINALRLDNVTTFEETDEDIFNFFFKETLKNGLNNDLFEFDNMRYALGDLTAVYEGHSNTKKNALMYAINRKFTRFIEDYLEERLA